MSGYSSIPKLRFRADAAMSDAEYMHVYIEVSVDNSTWVSISSFFINENQLNALVQASEEYFD